MGSWKIEIHGHGCHDNGREDDADAMARRFVRELKGAGHDVHVATFELTAADPRNLDGGA